MKKMKLSALTLGVGVAMALASSAANAGVMVHLFQWKFNDIANECETVLGPKGFDAVQITPPNEHKQGSDWWVVYQPVSYTNFNSRGGTEAELKSMIQRCKTAGVKIYVDAVFNQMAVAPVLVLAAAAIRIATIHTWVTTTSTAHAPSAATAIATRSKTVVCWGCQI